MNKKFIIIFFFVFLFCFALTSKAENEKYIVKFKIGFDVSPYSAVLTEISNENNVYYTDSIESLESCEDYIEYAQPDRKIIINDESEFLCSFPSDELYSQQYQLQMINADSFWMLEDFGNDVRIAVIDSGCILHNDIKKNIVGGWNYVDKNNDFSDNIGHGTHVSGIIGASMNDGGMCGTAPLSKIVCLKCFDKYNSTTIGMLSNAIYDAVDIYNCKIINASWGTSEDIVALKDAVLYALKKGVIIVAACGNAVGTQSHTALRYPASYSGVIGVGSVDEQKTLSWFSVYNESVFVCAPGENVKSTYNNSMYASLSGTSQATPMVSGIIANILSVNPSYNQDDIKRIVSESAADLGDKGYDSNYGWGLIDGNKICETIMREIPYYVSPINCDEDSSYVLVKNNTDKILNAVSIFSDYDSSRFLSSSSNTIKLLPGKHAILKTENKGNYEIKHFLWESMSSLVPLAVSR